MAIATIQKERMIKSKPCRSAFFWGGCRDLFFLFATHRREMVMGKDISDGDDSGGAVWTRPNLQRRSQWRSMARRFRRVFFSRTFRSLLPGVLETTWSKWSASMLRLSSGMNSEGKALELNHSARPGPWSGHGVANSTGCGGTIGSDAGRVPPESSGASRSWSRPPRPASKCSTSAGPQHSRSGNSLPALRPVHSNSNNNNHHRQHRDGGTDAYIVMRRHGRNDRRRAAGPSNSFPSLLRPTRPRYPIRSKGRSFESITTDDLWDVHYWLIAALTAVVGECQFGHYNAVAVKIPTGVGVEERAKGALRSQRKSRRTRRDGHTSRSGAPDWAQLDRSRYTTWCVCVCVCQRARVCVSVWYGAAPPLRGRCVAVARESAETRHRIDGQLSNDDPQDEPSIRRSIMTAVGYCVLESRNLTLADLHPATPRVPSLTPTIDGGCFLFFHYCFALGPRFSYRR